MRHFFRSDHPHRELPEEDSSVKLRRVLSSVLHTGHSDSDADTRETSLTAKTLHYRHCLDIQSAIERGESFPPDWQKVHFLGTREVPLATLDKTPDLMAMMSYFGGRFQNFFECVKFPVGPNLKVGGPVSFMHLKEDGRCAILGWGENARHATSIFKKETAIGKSVFISTEDGYYVITITRFSPESAGQFFPGGCFE